MAVHYRQAAESDVEPIEELVDRVISKNPELRMTNGKKVFEIQPRSLWDKGHAVRWLLANTELGNNHPFPLYIGDDLTDEDAFQAIAGDGIGIAVRENVRVTTADYALDNPEDVRRFLDWLVDRKREAAE
jgi:trehalose-phosphatase